jgi:hypothetical protein
VAGARTTGEERGNIDRRIDGSFEIYDRRIREAQEALDKEREKNGVSGGDPGGGGAAAGGGGSAGGGGPAGSAGGGSSASRGGTSASRGGSSSGGSSSGGRPGSVREVTPGGSGTSSTGGASGSGPQSVPSDVGSGSDDDIVARQLREAAMKEKDPELREKLWQEYRDYKKGGT